MKTSIKSILALLLCSTMALGSFIGCSSDSSTDSSTDNSSDSSSSTSDEIIEIELFSQKTEDIEIYDQVLAAYMEENPNVNIVQTTTASGTTFVARVAANDLPDIGGIYYLPDYFTMFDEGLFVDQTGEEYLEKINDTVVDLVTYTDGCIYMLPVSLNGFALYYNEDIYAEYGLEAPTTIDELFENCEILSANGVTPFAFPYKDTGSLGQLFERMIGAAVDTEVWDTNQAVADGASYSDFDEIVNFMEVWVQLDSYTNGDSLSLDQDGVATLFANGEVAMCLNGTWGSSVYAGLNEDLNYEAILMPSISGIESTSCGTVDIGLAISSDSDAIDECKAFLEYFVSDDVAQEFAEFDKNPTAVISVDYSDPNMQTITDEVFAGNFSLIPMTYQPSGFRTEIQIILQQLLLDGDIDAFLTSWDELTDEFYND